MALPLPRTVADVGPGGGLVTAMGGINSLANANLLRQMNAIKKQYLPTTMQAEAASKLAYANLMGPQFLAKIMGNDSAVANMSENQKHAGLDSVRRAAMGQGDGINAFNQMQQGAQGGNPSGIGNSFLGWSINKLKEAFHHAPKKISNAFVQGASIPGQYNGDSQYSSPPVQRNNNPSARPPGGVTVEGEQWYNSKGEPVYGEEAQQPNSQRMNLDLNGGQRPKTYAENTGAYKGIIEEGKELGRIRAASKKELDQDYQQALQLKQPFERLTKIITNPVFQNLRNIPGFQKMQMNAKATLGTPEEKKLIGEFQAAARQVVSATVKGFGGRILASEIPLSESMKLSDNDSIEAMLGKAPVIEAFNEMTLQRSRLASKLMKEQHLDKGDALEQADKMIDGDKIRQQVETALNPISEDDIDETARANKMTREQVIQRLKAEGRYNG